MKQILLILAGGTICTDLKEDRVLSVSGAAGGRLIDGFARSDSAFADQVSFDKSEDLFLLSENMTVTDWNLLYDVCRANLKRKPYDGVIIAHGTDTLAYSAALFSFLLSDCGVPVMFVSANRQPDAEGSNGEVNFRLAVELICAGIAPSVYVPYQNPSDKRSMLHLACRLKQCENYSEDFHSIGELDITSFFNTFDPAEIRSLRFDLGSTPENPQLALPADRTLSSRVLMIKPYVGIDYTAYDYGKFSAVLHGAYHSGTACAKNGPHSVFTMIDRCADCDPPVPCYLSPARKSGVIYESTDLIAAYRTQSGQQICFLYGMTDEAAYAKLLIAYSLFDDPTTRLNFLNTNLIGEIMA